MEVSFTKMSVKGQVVIPEEVRQAVSFNTSDKLVVYGSNGVVVIKKVITDKQRQELSKVFKLLDEKLSLTREDLEKEIQAVRAAKKR